MRTLTLSLTSLCCIAAICTGVPIYSCRTEVDIPLQLDFSFKVVDSNYNVPVTIQFANQTSGALFYKWTFPHGSPAVSSEKNPGYIVFDQPGTITVKLEAWNDFERQEKTLVIVLDTTPVAGFDAVPRINNYAPVDWDLNFTGKGATSYNWSFENAAVAGSTERDPRQVTYTTPGNYRIHLRITNDRGRTDTISKMITVLPSLTAAAFDIVPSFDDDDLEVPFTAKLANHTSSANTHQWQAQGGVLSSATDSAPTVTYTEPGNYTIQYTASNGKQTKQVTQTITVKPNTGLRYFKDVQLGINTAHASTGSFFSTYLRKVLVKDSVNAQNGPHIDLCYFGLSSSFSFNKFESPVTVQNLTFPAIPGARHTTIINKQENCNCGVSLTAAEFDQIAGGSVFDNLGITDTQGGLSAFDNATVPRVILFKNASGKKGAVKIKQFVQNGDASYIVCDIKVQKD